jgi:hypothetical protein
MRRGCQRHDRPLHRGYPAGSERLYDDEESRFLRAVQAWQTRTGRKFPCHTDYLTIVKSLGFRLSEG